MKDVEAIADIQPPDWWNVRSEGLVSRHLPIQRTINDLWQHIAHANCDGVIRPHTYPPPISSLALIVICHRFLYSQCWPQRNFASPVFFCIIPSFSPSGNVFFIYACDVLVNILREIIILSTIILTECFFGCGNLRLTESSQVANLPAA